MSEIEFSTAQFGSRTTADRVPGEIEMWIVPLRGESSTADRRLLSADERQRAEQFATTAGSHDYIHVRALLRQLLSTRTGCPAADLRFVSGTYGKPALVGSAVAFNLSHTRGLALIAIGESGSVGVDVEAVDIEADVVALTSRVLTPTEGLRVAGDRRRFLEHWVAKESYLKWLGRGLTIPPDTLQVSTDSRGRQLITSTDPSGPPPRRVYRPDLGPGHVGALVTDAPDGRIIVHP